MLTYSWANSRRGSYRLPTPITFQRSWKRYIDDIFFLWSGSPRSLQKLQESMNNIHPTIKFTFESSSENFHFLDVTLTLDNTTINTGLYTKPTDTHAYLSPSSCHPQHTFKSIVYSQALRVRRICSDHSAPPPYDSKNLNSTLLIENTTQKWSKNKSTAHARNRDRIFSNTNQKMTTTQTGSFTQQHTPKQPPPPHISSTNHFETLQQSEKNPQHLPETTHDGIPQRAHVKGRTYKRKRPHRPNPHHTTTRNRHTTRLLQV